MSYFAENRRKILIIGTAVLLAVLVGVLGFFTVRFFLNRNRVGDYAAVYQSSDGMVADLSGKTFVINNDSAGGFHYDKKSGRLYYTVPSSFKTGTFDLCYFSPDESSKGSDAVLVDYGIDELYYLSSDGNKLFYIKTSEKSGVREGCVFDTVNKKITSFVQNAERMYPTGTDNMIFFTRLHSSDRVLYSYSCGDDAPIELARGIQRLESFEKENTVRLIYECRSEDGSGTALNMVKPGERPVLICPKAESVIYDGYEAGGNLYYFTKTDSGIAWKQVISDNLYDSDSKLEEPKKSDFFSFFGFSLGYNTAKAEYDRKVERDELRKALDTAFSPDPVNTPMCDAYVYNDSKSVKLAGSVSPESFKAGSSENSPKLVFASTSISSTGLDLSDIYSYSRQNGIEEAVKYASARVTDGMTQSGLKVAVCYEGAVSVYDMTGHPDSADFSFTPDGAALYSFSRNVNGNYSVMSASFSDMLKPTAAEKVDTDVSDYRVDDNGLTYLKISGGAACGDLYSVKGGQKAVISNSSYAFASRGTGEIYSFKNYSSSGSNIFADYYSCGTDGEKLLVPDGRIDSLVVGESGKTCLLGRDGSGYSLFVCTPDGADEICDSVSKIIYID